MKKFLLYLGFLLVCALLVIPPFISKPIENNVLNFSLNISSIIILIISLILFYFYEFTENQLIKITFFQLLLNIGKVFLYFGILIAVQTSLSLLGYLFNCESNAKIQFEKNVFNFVSAFLMLGISAFYEEVLYRLYLPSTLKIFFDDLLNKVFTKKDDKKKEKCKKIVNLIIELSVIIIFGFSHLYLGVIPVLNGIICGFVLRYCCIKNKTVITGTTSHWLYNCFIFIAVILL